MQSAYIWHSGIRYFCDLDTFCVYQPILWPLTVDGLINKDQVDEDASQLFPVKLSNHLNHIGPPNHKLPHYSLDHKLQL